MFSNTHLLHATQPAQEQSTPTKGGSISRFGGLMMCELSVDDEGQQSGQDDGGRNWRDNWNNWDEKWVQDEKTNSHQIEEWVQMEMRDGHKN